MLRAPLRAAGVGATGGRDIIMGDRNPKALQKQAAQKQAKSNAETQRKQAAVSSPQIAKPSLSAKKK
jgi:hypothetical protein